MNDAIKCDACGRFISYAEMQEGGGARFYFEPDSHRGPERCEWTCEQCLDKNWREAEQRAMDRMDGA